MRKTVIIFILLVCFIAIISNFVDGNINGKTIALIGDSLMEGYGNDLKSFEYYFSKDLPDSKFINLSKDGATITNNSGGDRPIINQVKLLTGEPEIIIFDGGANDIIDYGLGFLANDLKKEIGIVDVNSYTLSNNNTVINDFEEIIIEMKNKFPNAKIYYLQLFLIDDMTIDNITLDESKKPEMRTRRDELYEQIEIACKKWNITYIDISDKLIGTGTKYRQEDWIHLKEEGYQMITPYILENLK